MALTRVGSVSQDYRHHEEATKAQGVELVEAFLRIFYGNTFKRGSSVVKWF